MKFKDEAHKSRIASTRNILAERETWCSSSAKDIERKKIWMNDVIPSSLKFEVFALPIVGEGTLMHYKPSSQTNR